MRRLAARAWDWFDRSLPLTPKLAVPLVVMTLLACALLSIELIAQFRRAVGEGPAAREMMIDVLVVMGTICVVYLVLMVWVIHVVVLKRARRLSQAALRVAGGDLQVRLPEGEQPRSRDDLYAVSQQFDRMVTELRRSFEEQRRVVEKMTELDRAKTTLLQAVSHEVRTPLTAVLGMAFTLRDRQSDLSAEQTEGMLSKLAANAQRLEQLIGNLLDLDRISRGGVDLQARRTELSSLCCSVVERLEADRHEIVLDLEACTSIVDPAFAERILENLVGNAIRHTPSGTRIEVKLGPCQGGVLLCVEDTGPGVPEELRTKVFEPFERGIGHDHSPGTGLGLAIVSHFAQLHGGRAWVEDRDGGGASFRVHLPAASG